MNIGGMGRCMCLLHPKNEAIHIGHRKDQVSILLRRVRAAVSEVHDYARLQCLMCGSNERYRALSGEQYSSTRNWPYQEAARCRIEKWEVFKQDGERW